MVRVRENGDVVLVEGVLTLKTVTEALRQSQPLFANGTAPLVFDLGGVEQSDSAALALLLEWLRQGRRDKREVRYRNLPQRLMQLGRISEVDELIAPDTA